MNSFEYIVKRDGTSVKFDQNRITIAIEKAMRATNTDITKASDVSNMVCEKLREKSESPTVEECQDIVEKCLMDMKFFDTAKAYILYREKHTSKRKTTVSEAWRKESKEAASLFPTAYQYIIYLRTYSKWLDRKGRRENWIETVDRFMNFMMETTRGKFSDEEHREIRDAILTMQVVPSMRMLQFAGDACRRNNICAYNCAFLTISRISDFHDAMFILMSGAGVGFSVEKRFVSKLPVIERQTEEILPLHVIEDSREGWCSAFHVGLKCWYLGKDISFDYSQIRPEGARLITSGGRASGPEPLKLLMTFTRKLLLDNQGSKLSTIQAYDMMCMVGNIVLVGGVRRCLAKDSVIYVLKDNNYEKVKIQDVKSNDLVKTKVGPRRVISTFSQGVQKIINVIHDHGTLRCTPDHKIMIWNGWARADSAKTGDHLSYMGINNEMINFSRVLGVMDENEEIETYDLEIEEDHHFLCDGIVVHNCSEISLSDLDDELMRDAKKKGFDVLHSIRYITNNSAVYNIIPSDQEMLDEWLALIKSNAGERGIFSRTNLAEQIPARRLEKIKDAVRDIGTNPCGEILLLPYEFCNLSSVILRPDDKLEDMMRKTRIATMIGTYQSTLTNFKNIAPEWKQSCEMERLLGVSLTGQRDCKFLQDNIECLDLLREETIKVNKIYAERLGINPSAAITTVKPEGTTSEMMGTSSGIHLRFSPFYLRRIRISSTDPLAQLLIDQGVPFFPEVKSKIHSVSTWVFEFPIKSPEGSLFVKDFTAIQQLDYWKEVKVRYTEHNPSCTIYVKDNEWIEVLFWLKQNWKHVGGLSFLPFENSGYELKPLDAITEEEYLERVAKFPKLDFSKLILYEVEDCTTRKTQWACKGDSCSME